VKNSKHFSEVIQSSLTNFIAQSWVWDVYPTFGSLVTIESNKRTIFGLVHHIQTGSMDPTRYPFPYQKTEAELLAEQPQIFEFLKTSFTCQVLGYQEKGKIYYLLAPEPPNIHAFVGHASKEQQQLFFAHDAYLHLLFGAQLQNLDELLLALLKQQQELNILGENKLDHFIESFSLLTGNDYRRLKLFLQRVEKVVS
jgi:hypothetical protein